MAGLRRRLDSWIEAFNRWLASPAGFVQAIVVTLVWSVIAFATPWDRQGFLFLFVCTAFSQVTQFTVAIIAQRAALSAGRDAEQMEKLIGNQIDLMRVVVALAEEIKSEVQDTSEMVEEMHDLHATFDASLGVGGDHGDVAHVASPE